MHRRKSGKRTGDSGASRGNLNRTEQSPRTEIIRSCTLRSLQSTAYVSSTSSYSFIIPIRLPQFSDQPLKALLDCGATKSFIDEKLAALRPDLLKQLKEPVIVELFDGHETSAGSVKYNVPATLIFPDDQETTHVEDLLVTRVHPAASVVLSLAWLRKWNPLVNWTRLSLRFRDSVRAIVGICPKIKSAEDPLITEAIDEDSTQELPSKPTDPPLKLPITLEQVEDIDDPLDVPTPENTKQKTYGKPPPISLISAAALLMHIKRGETAYTFQVTPSKLQESLPTTNGESSASEEEPENLEELIPIEYHDFLDVFAEKSARTLPPHRSYDHTIEIEEGTKLPTGRIYNMSEIELKALKEYLDEMLGKGFIRASHSSTGAPVVFVKKKDGGLRLCVDYRGLNQITRKSRYPIPLIGNLIDQLKSAKIYSKIDLRSGYNNVRIAKGQEWLTAFRTRYGLFEYLVMPFGLTNAPATFQYFMNDIFHDMVDLFVVVYLDDILIYSDSLEEHQVHVKKVLARLQQHDLHARPHKCQFHTKSVEYLGVIVTPNGITMDPGKIQTILDWPAPKTVKELQSFLGFANFYRRFIDNYSGIVVPLTRLLRKDIKWKWGERQQQVFDLLKEAFTAAPILRHFDPKLPVIVECDASDYAIAAIVSQIDPITQEIRPVAFHARTMISAELNYDVYDKELLAIYEAFKQWRCYLEGAQHIIQVYSDHNNLQYFTTTKQLSRRQARWSEYLSNFGFLIHYRPGRLGTKPDALTRRPDVYPKKSFQAEVNSFNNRIAIRPELMNAVILLDEEALIHEIKEAPKDDFFKKNERNTSKQDSPYSLSPDGRLLLRNGKIYVSDHEDLRYQVLQEHHDHKLRGHPGIFKTTKLIQRTYFWPRLQRDVTHYVRACHQCARAKTVRHSPYGFLKPLPVGERPWASISMDHVEQLPDSNGYDSILVVICRLTKQAILISAHTTDTATELAQYFIQHVFSKHGLPADIISDRGHLFVSKFWKSLCKALDITSNLSTAYHPETDGQTERTIQTIEQYLRIFVNYQQDDWESRLPLAEFVYNNTPHSATGVSPFFANKGYNPRLTISLMDIPAHEAHLAATDLKSLHGYLRDQIRVANEAYARFEDPHRTPTPDWPVGTMVWLDWRNIKTKRPMKKLDHKRHGPFKIIAKVSTHAYRLQLPASLKGIHNVFHVSLLEKVAKEHFPQRRPNPPPPIEVDSTNEYEVAAILDSRRRRKTIQYLIRWEGYGPEDDTWEPVESLQGSQELLDGFHKTYPKKPRANY